MHQLSWIARVHVQGGRADGPGLQAQRPLMGQHHVQAGPQLLPGPPDRTLVLQAQDEVTACVINGLKCLGIVGRILLHSMGMHRMPAASPAPTGNALGKPRLTAGVFLLGNPTTTCCGFVSQLLSSRTPRSSYRLRFLGLWHTVAPQKRFLGELRASRAKKEAVGCPVWDFLRVLATWSTWDFRGPDRGRLSEASRTPWRWSSRPLNFHPTNHFIVIPEDRSHRAALP